MLLFEQDEEIHNNMSVVRSKAFEIVDQSNIINQQYKKLKESPNATETYIESQEVVVKARQKMYDLRCSILNDYQGRIFNGIRNLLEGTQFLLYKQILKFGIYNLRKKDNGFEKGKRGKLDLFE